MFKETVLTRSLRLMFSSGVVLGLGVLAQPVLAQDTTPTTIMPRVEVTGSSIKRIDAEGALPVTIVNAEAIRTSGVT